MIARHHHEMAAAPLYDLPTAGGKCANANAKAKSFFWLTPMDVKEEDQETSLMYEDISNEGRIEGYHWKRIKSEGDNESQQRRQ